MATDFQGQLAEDAAVFFNASEFAEAITYRSSSGGSFTDKAINAVVVRGAQVDSIRLGSKPFNAKVVEITVSKDATLGVATVKPGLDHVKLYLKLGDAAVTEFLVEQILEHDRGVWRLECTA